MTTMKHQVELVFTVEDPTEEYNVVDLPRDIYQALTDGWKDEYEGDPWWISQISSRDTFGRIAILERANAEQGQTIVSLDLSNQELRQEQRALKEALARQDKFHDGLNATSRNQARTIEDIHKHVLNMMGLLGIGQGYLDEDDLGVIKAAAKEARDQLNDAIDTIEAAE